MKKIRAKDFLKKGANGDPRLQYAFEALEQVMEDVPEVVNNYSFRQALKLLGEVISRG